MHVCDLFLFALNGRLETVTSCQTSNLENRGLLDLCGLFELARDIKPHPAVLEHCWLLHQIKLAGDI